MKKFAISVTVLTFAISIPVHAGEVFGDPLLTSGVSTISQESMQDLNTCLTGSKSTSHAIRACTNALKVVVPRNEIRSEIYTRRALLNLSSGKLDRATRDFKYAARLDGRNEFAVLGQGYVELVQKNYEAAKALFEDCAEYSSTAPLAVYGRAMAKELSGDITGAYADYKHALELRPDWAAPKEELERFVSTSQ